MRSSTTVAVIITVAMRLFISPRSMRIRASTGLAELARFMPMKAAKGRRPMPMDSPHSDIGVTYTRRDAGDDREDRADQADDEAAAAERLDVGEVDLGAGDVEEEQHPDLDEVAARAGDERRRRRTTSRRPPGRATRGR